MELENTKVDLKEFSKKFYPEHQQSEFNKLPFVKSIRDEAKEEIFDTILELDKKDASQGHKWRRILEYVEEQKHLGEKK